MPVTKRMFYQFSLPRTQDVELYTEEEMAQSMRVSVKRLHEMLMGGHGISYHTSEPIYKRNVIINGKRWDVAQVGKRYFFNQGAYDHNLERMAEIRKAEKKQKQIK